MLVILAILIIPLYNCGGTEGPNDAVGVSPFAGNWAGTWSDSNGQSGTFSLNIFDNGIVTGSIYNAAQNETASVSTGFIDYNGNLNFTITYPGPTIYTASGTASGNDIGDLVGSFNEYSGATSIATVTFILSNSAPSNG